MKNTKPRIIYNDDSASINVIQPPISPDRVYLAVDHLAGSQVDCLCWKVYRRFTAGWDSKVCETEHEMYFRSQPYPANHMRYDLYHQGIDYLPILIEETRKRGIRFYPSFRMNDCHHRSRPGGAARFWKDHQDWRLWEVTDGRTYYNAAMDYSHPEVREQIFAAIEEFTNTYDVDGIELDFCRNPYTFQPSEAWDKRKILTDFVRRFRQMTVDAGLGRGRPVDLLVRLPFAEEKLRAAGMDVSGWIEEKLFDILVMSHLKNNYDLDLEPWRTLCREHDVLFYPSLEAGPMDNAPAHNHVVRESPDEIVSRQRAAAQNILAQDPDGIYMFNYPCLLFGGGVDAHDFKDLTGILSEIGDRRTLRGTAKQYLFWQSLPITVEANRPPQFHQTIVFHVRDPALEQADTRVCLRFRQVAEGNPHAKGDYEQSPAVGPAWMKYLLNDQEVEIRNIECTPQPAGPIQSGFTLTEHELISIRPPASMLRNGRNSLAFHVPRFPDERDPYVHIYELLVDVARISDPRPAS